MLAFTSKSLSTGFLEPEIGLYGVCSITGNVLTGEVIVGSFSG